MVTSKGENGVEVLNVPFMTLRFFCFFLRVLIFTVFFRSF